MLKYPFLRMAAAAIALAIPAAPAMAEGGVTFDRSIRKDGTSDFKVRARLPGRWNSSLGLDLGVPGEAEADDRAVTITPLQRQPAQPSTAAWGRLEIPGPSGTFGWTRTTIDARFDPIGEQGRVSGTVMRRWTIGEALNASLSGRLTVVETGIGQAGGVTAWETERSAGVEFRPTGTALIARGNWSQTDPVLHGSLVAEQRLFRGARLSTTLSEIETGEPVWRVGGELRRTW